MSTTSSEETIRTNVATYASPEINKFKDNEEDGFDDFDLDGVQDKIVKKLNTENSENQEVEQSRDDWTDFDD
ncbi:hypothetical protein ABK040_009404 [Willaertia magna]